MTDIIIKLLIGIEVIVALLMITVILMQQSKSGGGLGSAMGGDMAESMLGAGASSFLAKTTTILATIFLGITLILAVITGQRRSAESVAESVTEEPGIEEQATMEGDEDGAEGADAPSVNVTGEDPGGSVEMKGGREQPSTGSNDGSESPSEK